MVIEDVHKLAVQMRTNLNMLEKFYSIVSARMNAAEHAYRKRLDWSLVEICAFCTFLIDSCGELSQNGD